MSLRISSSLLCALALTGCDQATDSLAGSTIDCAIGAGADYSPVCSLEQAADETGAFFLLHHPDGGFRRVQLDAQTGDLRALDGAHEVRDRSTGSQGVREFVIADDRYLVPVELLVSENG